MAALVSDRPPLDSFVRPPFPVRRWSVAEYEHLTETGILTADDKVELLEGWIVPQMTQNAPHDSAIQRLVRRLFQSLRGDWDVRAQSAIRTSDSVPEPDIAVVPGPEGRFDHQRTAFGEVELAIEVAATSLRLDRRKRAIYAAAGVPFYWIVNLKQRVVEVYSQPDPEAREHQVERIYAEGEQLPVVIPGKTVCKIAVENVLPSKKN